jgi:DNA-binding MarR family transcriptional regulator
MIGALLRRPVGVLRRRILEGLAARGFGDLHSAHLNVFQHPGPRGLRPTELAAAAGMTKQAMNHLLGQLESLGYVERRPLTPGSRGVAIWPTHRGEAAIKAIRSVISGVEGEWAAAMGADRYRTLRALLVDLNSVVEPDRGSATTSRAK